MNLIQGWSKISKRTSFMDHVALTVASRFVHELERKRGIAKSYFNTYVCMNLATIQGTTKMLAASFHKFCSCCCLPLLPQLVCSIHATWPRSFIGSLNTKSKQIKKRVILQRMPE